jgi:hypothetical protein
MTQVSNFVQVRADGKLVPSTLTVKEMLALGWTPSKVVALRWTHDGKEVEVDAPYGVHGIVVPGANFVAAVHDEEEADRHGRLMILSPNGSVYSELENRVSVFGHEYNGRYGWFEPAMTPRIDTFGAVFQTDGQGDLRCDVDASGPQLLNAVRIR